MIGGRETAVPPTLGDTSSATSVEAPEGGVRLLLQPSQQTGPFLLAGIANHLRSTFAGDPHQAEPGLGSAALFGIERTAIQRGVVDVPRGHRERLAITAALMTAVVWWAESGEVRPFEISCPDRRTAIAVLSVLHHGGRAEVGESLRLDETAPHIDHMQVLRDLEAFNPEWVLDAKEAA